MTAPASLRDFLGIEHAVELFCARHGTIFLGMTKEQMESPHFGSVAYDKSGIVVFPAGLPAFETEHRFVLLEEPGTEPVVFLQSLETPRLIFMTVPVSLLIPEQYPLVLTPEEEQLLEIEKPPSPGDLLLLAILTVHPSRQVTANLMAPVVIHTKQNRGIQSPQAHMPFEVEHPLTIPAVPDDQEDHRCS